MTQTTPPSTCPACGATVRQDVPWCLQCYASLHPEAAAPAAAPEQLTPEQLTPEQPLGHQSVAGQVVDAQPDGEHVAPTAQDAAAAAAEANRVADELMARLAYEDRQVNWVARLESFPGGRTGAIAAGIVGAGIVVLLVLTLIGLVL
ncbi:hypothetical protein [Angustibacter luteus]